MPDYRIDELEKLLPEQLREQILQDARKIAGATPLSSDSWDDPEQWTAEAARLAHAIVTYIRRLSLDPSLQEIQLNRWRKEVSAKLLVHFSAYLGERGVCDVQEVSRTLPDFCDSLANLIVL